MDCTGYSHGSMPNPKSSLAALFESLTMTFGTLDLRFDFGTAPPTPHDTIMGSRVAIHTFGPLSFRPDCGTGSYLKEPRPGLTTRPLSYNLTHLIESVKNG